MHVSKFRNILVLIAFALVMPDMAQAFGFGNMMNPSRWFGGGHDRYDDDYYGAPPYGYGYPGGYAVPGYAAPGYTVPGYAPQGYAAPAYGYGAPANTAPATPKSTPAAASKTPPVISSDEAEIARLKERIRALEATGESARHAGGAPATGQPDHSPYGQQQYTFPNQSSGAADTSSGSATGEPEYPVYSPFGPPAKFPPLQPDAGASVETDVVTTPAPAAAPVKQAAAAATPDNAQDTQAGVVNFSPYGNPANYVPPVQESGQRVYDLGH